MIDFDLTISRFFASVEKFLEKRAQKPFDKNELKVIQEAQAQVKKFAANPKKYAGYNARRIDNLDVNPGAFIKHGSHDNSAYLAYEGVICILEDFYKYPNNDYYIEQLLARIKTWNLTQATNMFKNFYYSVVPNTYFAVKVDVNSKKR